MKSLLVLLALLPGLTEEPQRAEAALSTPSTKVEPGECFTNGDQVTACTDKESKKNATITPSKGSKKSKTTVTTESKWIGTVDGIDANDRVSLGSSNTATVSGSGGSVKVGGNSTVTVINNGVNVATPIAVSLPSGTSVQVWPGGSVTITT